MSLSRRKVLAALAATAAPLSPSIARAATYPDRPIRFVVPFAPGGNSDIVGRIVGEMLAASLKQPVVVDNRPGAGGAVGADHVVRSAPDGYTFMIATNGPMTVNPFVNAKLGYDPLKDFAPVTMMASTPHLLCLSAASGIKSIAELVERAKAKPINIGTSGVGSATHMTLARFEKAAGTKLVHVPYRSGGAVLPDLMSGVIDGVMTEISTVAELHKAGQARIVGIFAKNRAPLAPDAPTADEAGLKGFLAQSFVGLVAPAKTPPEIIEVVAKAIGEGLKPSSATAAKLVGHGSDIAAPADMGPQGFGAYLKREYDAMAEAAKLAEIVPN